jgi:hypothetical protein
LSYWFAPAPAPGPGVPIGGSAGPVGCGVTGDPLPGSDVVPGEGVDVDPFENVPLPSIDAGGAVNVEAGKAVSSAFRIGLSIENLTFPPPTPRKDWDRSAT